MKMKKKDWILILIIAAAAVCLLIVGLSSRKSSEAPAASELQTIELTDSGEAGGKEPETTEHPASETAEAETESTAPEAAASTEAAESEAAADPEAHSAAAEKAAAYLAQYPAESYVLVTVGSNVYSPIPLTEDNAFKVHVSESEYNVVHIGKNSVYMEESTCDNQNCVGEGEVTLENRDSRALYNMILCLPHDLMLELLDADEALEYMTSAYETQAAYEAYAATQAAAEEGNADAG